MIQFILSIIRIYQPDNNEVDFDSKMDILSRCKIVNVLWRLLSKCLVISMSDREPTRWQHNRIYPHPINPCVYTYDSIYHLQISI